MNGDIVQARLAQGADIRLAHDSRLQGQLFGIMAKRLVNRRQFGATPVARDGMNEGVRFRIIKTLDLSPEVMRVGLRSIDAAVGLADDRGQHLPLLPR